MITCSILRHDVITVWWCPVNLVVSQVVDADIGRLELQISLSDEHTMKDGPSKVVIPLVSEQDTKALLEKYRRAAQLAARSAEKAQKNKAALQKVWDDLLTLTRLLRAWARREYTAVPWRILVAVVAVLIYFLNPFDLIPDFLPTLGLVDDATLVGLVVASIGEDLAQFREWESKKREN